MFRVYRDLIHGEQIIVAADTGNGGGDYCAAQFYSQDMKDIPLVYHSPGIAPDMTDDLVGALERIADATGVKPVVTYELNNGGLNELVRLSKLNRKHKWHMWHPKVMKAGGIMEDADRPGWTTTEQARRAMLVDLKQAIDNRELKVYDRQTVSELHSFVNMKRPGGGWKPQAENGAHDDLVMALAITWQISLSVTSKHHLTEEEPAYERAYDPYTGRLLS